MLLIVSLLLLACRPDTRVNGSMRTPPEIPEQPNLASITSWEGKIVAFSDSFDAKTQQWKKVPLILDTQTRQLKRWTEGRHSPLGVSQNEHSSAYAFDSSGRVGIRIRRSNDSLLLLTTIPTERYQGHQVEGSVLVVVTRDSIHFKSDSTTWRAIANTVEGDFPDLLLKDGVLYLGSDNGEWGGIAARSPETRLRLLGRHPRAAIIQGPGFHSHGFRRIPGRGKNIALPGIPVSSVLPLRRFHCLQQSRRASHAGGPVLCRYEKPRLA